MVAWDIDKPDDADAGADGLHAVATEPAAPAFPAAAPLVLQPRDLDLFAYVARHGVCTPEQLHRHFWQDRASRGVYRRLQKLTYSGYLLSDRTWYHGPLAVRVTKQALRAAELPFHPIRLGWGRLQHQLAMVDLSEVLLRRHPDASWRTERELRQDWYSDRARGIEHRRLPDGMLCTLDERIAIELELTDKRPPDYRALGDAYLQELILGIAQIWWFVASPRITEQLTRYFAPAYGNNPWRAEQWVAS